MLPAWATVALSLGVALIASGGTFGATLLQLSRAEKERLDRERSRRIERTATVVGALNSLLSDAAPRRVANSDDERPDEALRAAWRPLRADLMTLGAILYEPGVGEIIGGMIAEVDPQIRAARKSDQEAIVAQLLADNEGLAERWNSYRRYLLVLAKRFFRKSGRYQLFAPRNLGKGDQNIYRMFIETALRMTAPNGYAAQVLPSNLYNGANAAAIRRELLENWDLQWVLGFINENEHWFKGIHTDTKFAIYSARKRAPRSDLHIGFRIQSDQELHTAIEQGERSTATRSARRDRTRSLSRRRPTVDWTSSRPRCSPPGRSSVKRSTDCHTVITSAKSTWAQTVTSSSTVSPKTDCPSSKGGWSTSTTTELRRMSRAAAVPRVGTICHSGHQRKRSSPSGVSHATRFRRSLAIEPTSIESPGTTSHRPSMGARSRQP